MCRADIPVRIVAGKNARATQTKMKRDQVNSSVQVHQPLQADQDTGEAFLHGSRSKAVHCRLAQHGLKRNRHSTSLCMLNMPKASPSCSTPQRTWSIRCLAYRFDFLRNKSGRIWHCRIPLSEIGEACYYGYSVSGEAVSTFIALIRRRFCLIPYARCVFFPPDFDRKLAMREGSNAGNAPLAMLPTPHPIFDWEGSHGPHHESDVIIYELHVKGFTKNS